MLRHVLYERANLFFWPPRRFWLRREEVARLVELRVMDLPART